MSYYYNHTKHFIFSIIIIVQLLCTNFFRQGGEIQRESNPVIDEVGLWMIMIMMNLFLGPSSSAYRSPLLDYIGLSQCALFRQQPFADRHSARTDET